MSTRTDELEEMTDPEATASLEYEFPMWLVYRGTSHLCVARRRDGAVNLRDDTDKAVILQGEDWVDLRFAIIRWIWESEDEGATA